MPIGPDITPTPAPIPGDPRPDDAASWSERRLAILSELAEAGLEIALALKTRIVETAAAEPDADSAGACADLTRAFDRASRAARMAVALRERVVKEAAPGVQAARAASQAARAHRAERVHRIVRRVTKARFKDDTLREAVEGHTREWLFDPDITGDLAGRPIGALVAQICADLGISPPWLDFAQEAWAQEEITERPAGSPYAAWPDLPPDEPDPEPDAFWDDNDVLEDGNEADDEPDYPGGDGGLTGDMYAPKSPPAC